MKDVVISSKRIKREGLILFFCFLVANLTNLYAIFAYQTAFSELISQIGYVCLFTLALYVFLGLCRFVYYLIMKFLKNKK
jgi:hypothetical protein